MPKNNAILAVAQLVYFNALYTMFWLRSENFFDMFFFAKKLQTRAIFGCFEIFCQISVLCRRSYAQERPIFNRELEGDPTAINTTFRLRLEKNVNSIVKCKLDRKM